MAFVFLFCVHVTPSILRAVGRLSVCACAGLRVREVSGAHVVTIICELVNQITFDTHLH